MEIFHREIPVRELLCQFYAIQQGPHETVAQFVLRFQELYRQVASDVSANHLTDTFLGRLREPLRTTLALTDFSKKTIEQVVTRVLALTCTQKSNTFAMGRYRKPFQLQKKHSSGRPVTPPWTALPGHIAQSATDETIRSSNVNITCSTLT